MITICKDAQYNHTEGVLLGYDHMGQFYRGITANESVWSWTGLAGNLTYNQTLDKLFKPDLANIEVSPSTSTRMFVPYGICKIVEGKPRDILDPKFHRLRIKITDGTYRVYVSDPETTSDFKLPYPTMSGDKMEIWTKRNSSTTKLLVYNIDIKETIMNNGNASCRQYSHDHKEASHVSYADCIHDLNRKLMLPILGCTIPWMDNSNHCLQPFLHLPEYEGIKELLKDIVTFAWAGFDYSSDSCPSPCTFLAAHVKKQGLTKTYNGENEMTLYFEKKVSEGSTFK